MRASSGEIRIAEILEEAGLDFVEEYSFKDLVSNKHRELRFDFCVFDDDGEIAFLIEYQGIQHYEARSKFGGIAGLKRQQYHDMLKREYCKKHKYVLLVIPYVDEYLINYDYIMSRYYKEEDKLFSEK